MTDDPRSREAIKPSPNTPSVEGDRLTLEVALRRLGVERDHGHCGEGSLERAERDRHNEAVDVVLAALPCKGGEDEAAREREYSRKILRERDEWIVELIRERDAARDTGRGLREALEDNLALIEEAIEAVVETAIEHDGECLVPAYLIRNLRVVAPALAALSDTQTTEKQA